MKGLARSRALKWLAHTRLGGFVLKHEEGEEVVALAIGLNVAWSLLIGGVLGASVASAAILAPGMIDLSNNNGARASVAISAPYVQVVEAKATEGLGFRDGDYSVFRSTAARYHRAFGGYLFLHPYLNGAAQADYFLAFAHPRRGDIQPVVDSEIGSPSGAARATYAALHELARHGYSPILYASSYYLSQLVRAVPAIKQFRVWDAEYGPTLHTVAGVRYVAWQFTDRAYVHGFSVDGSHLLVRSVRSIEYRPLPVKSKPKPKHKTKPAKPAGCKHA